MATVDLAAGAAVVTPVAADEKAKNFLDSTRVQLRHRILVAVAVEREAIAMRRLRKVDDVVSVVACLGR